ncbi:MAG: NAD(P)/FAD-dependent oxidoreductase [Acidimicrobiia bacterium]
MNRIVVVGASLAGLRGVEALRANGFDGPIALVGAESHLPYDRPPLSKEMLSGAWERDRTVLRTQPYDDLDLDLHLGVAATRLDLDRRQVALADDHQLEFDGLLIATGATPRQLPDVPDLDGIFTLRTIDDCLAIRDRLDSGPRVCVIGGGFIGAEVAATCRGRGLDVTVVEALPQPMVRGLGERLGATLAALHRSHGVDLRTAVSVEAIEGDSHVEAVRLGDGTRVACDVLIIAIGVVPETRWLEGSGLTLDNGVVCDATLKAAPGVVAAGDVARWSNPRFGGELMRLEHWTNAVESGVHAAGTLLGAAEPFAPVPFVWSDQYDVKIQAAGRFGPDDEMLMVDGALEEFRFAAAFGRGGRLVGALGFSRPRQLMLLRRLIAEGAPLSAAHEIP